MKGQVTLEELLSFGVYLLLLSMLISAVFTLRDTGDQWSSRTILRAEAGSFARTYDAFFNSNLYNPYRNYSGSGRGYIEFEEGAAVPVLSGKMEGAVGEAV